MLLQFYKYQGTGNDFVILDNREGTIQLSKEQVALLCDRHFGIGSDGLMLLNKHETYDFEMVYYNADGALGTMCGNGGRCLTKFAFDKGIQANTHYIRPVSALSNYDVFTEGKKIRYNETYNNVGINVNFVEWNEDELFVRTYERGVENETFSCGTGVTAAAIAMSADTLGHQETKIRTLGGSLLIKFNKVDTQNYNNVWLCGPASLVFEGQITI